MHKAILSHTLPHTHSLPTLEQLTTICRHFPMVVRLIVPYLLKWLQSDEQGECIYIYIYMCVCVCVSVCV
jgi:hypothetical protein